MSSPAVTRSRRPLGARVLPSRLHYGWWVCLGIAALTFVTVGVGYYGLAVFLRPLQEEHGWSNSAVSGASGLFFAVSGLTGFLIGPRIDRRGPLRFLTVGVIVLGLAVIALGRVSTLWQLYVVYVIQAAAFGLAGNVSLNSIMTRWFITRRAQAMSISSTGVSLGGVILSPLGSWLIDRGGIALAAPAMGTLVILLGLPIVVGVLAWDPSHLDLEPDGGSPDEMATAGARSEAVQHRIWTRADASRTVAFWAITVGFVLILIAQTGFLLHQIAFLEDRLGSRSAAALALSTTAVGSIIARLIVGRFADRIDKRILTIGLFVLQGCTTLGLLAMDNRVITYVLVLVFGFTIGNVYMMQSLLISEIFGLVSMGTVFGVIALASQMGSGFGPFLVGWLEDQTGSYTTPFMVTATLTFLAAGAVSFARSQ